MCEELLLYLSKENSNSQFPADPHDCQPYHDVPHGLQNSGAAALLGVPADDLRAAAGLPELRKQRRQSVRDLGQVVRRPSPRASSRRPRLCGLQQPLVRRQGQGVGPLGLLVVGPLGVA